jgi:hypothetical protein
MAHRTAIFSQVAVSVNAASMTREPHLRYPLQVYVRYYGPVVLAAGNGVASSQSVAP